MTTSRKCCAAARCCGRSRGALTCGARRAAHGRRPGSHLTLMRTRRSWSRTAALGRHRDPHRAGGHVRARRRRGVLLHEPRPASTDTAKTERRCRAGRTSWPTRARGRPRSPRSPAARRRRRARAPRAGTGGGAAATGHRQRDDRRSRSAAPCPSGWSSPRARRASPARAARRSWRRSSTSSATPCRTCPSSSRSSSAAIVEETLDSGGAPRFTDSNGQAFDTIVTRAVVGLAAEDGDRDGRGSAGPDGGRLGLRRLAGRRAPRPPALRSPSSPPRRGRRAPRSPSSRAGPR